MGYFPFFVDLQGKAGLVVGAGAVARRKVEKLLPFGARLRVVTPEICPALRELPGVTLDQRLFRPEDLEGVDFAVAAAGSVQVDQQVARLCRRMGIPVNTADGGEGTFLFPALIRRGMLTVGVSTGGVSPGAAACLRDRMEAALPDRTEEILVCLHAYRERVRALPEPLRRQALAAALEACLERGRPLEPAEQERLLEEYRTGGERK